MVGAVELQIGAGEGGTVAAEVKRHAGALN